MQINAKPWYTSATVWSATFQAVIGLLSALVMILQNGLTNESGTMLVVGIKGLIDLRQRFITNQSIQ